MTHSSQTFPLLFPFDAGDNAEKKLRFRWIGIKRPLCYAQMMDAKDS